MKAIDLPPFAPILIESTRAIGYSLEAAIADIIDNSIAADASNVHVRFFPVDEPYLAIIDDGCGMDDEEITQAMQYGSANPLEERSRKDLGRFGLGLKTASLSQCRQLTVVSKNGSHYVGRRWDIDFVNSTGKWSLIVLNEEEIRQLECIDTLQAFPTGTMVLWKNLDRMQKGEINFIHSMGDKMEEVGKHLSLVYHRYISGESGIKKLTIYMNGEKLAAADPYLQKRSFQAMADESYVLHGEKITIRPYILPHISKLTAKEIALLGGKDGLRKQQGFYIYRNKRLLVWGTWFRMMRQGDLSKLARIQVDIPNTLDDLWTLDIKKSTAIPPPELRKCLETVIQNIAEKSKQTWVFRGKKEITDQVQHVWNRLKRPNGDVLYEINRDHPLVSASLDAAADRGAIETLLRQIEQSLPVNQLYVDMNADEHFENEIQVPKAEVKEMLYSLLALCPNTQAKHDLIESVKTTEPFIFYPALIADAEKEVN